MNIHSSIAWLFLNAVGIALAAIVVFDVVNLARKAGGRALILPQYVVMARARSSILIAILLLLAAVVGFALVAARPGGSVRSYALARSAATRGQAYDCQICRHGRGSSRGVIRCLLIPRNSNPTHHQTTTLPK